MRSLVKLNCAFVPDVGVCARAKINMRVCVWKMKIFLLFLKTISSSSCMVCFTECDCVCVRDN